jgi:urease accessory protein
MRGRLEKLSDLTVSVILPEAASRRYLILQNNNEMGALKSRSAEFHTSLARAPDVTNALDIPRQHLKNSSDRDLQRADGVCRIAVCGSGKATSIMDVYQQSPIRILFPKTGDEWAQEAVLVNTAGGVAGGDHLQLSVRALSGASLAVTTQAAERIYQALDQSAHINTKLHVGNEARLAWLPQETIVFNHARLCRRTEIEISAGSELLALEWLVLGRAARGEQISAGAINETWQVKNNGRLQWADTLRLTNDVFSHASRKALLGESTALATLLYFGPQLDHRLQFIRAQSASFDCHRGATLVGGMLVARLAAKSSFELKDALRNLIHELGKELAPGPFRVPRMWSC